MRAARLCFPALLLLHACVYSSPVPLGEPAEAVFDEALLGSWVSDGLEPDAATRADTEASVLRVERGPGREYVVYWRERTADVNAESRGRAFITVLEDVRFLNIVDADEDGVEYSFARYVVEGDRLRLRFIADANDRGLSEKFGSSAALRAAVRARLEDPQLYEEEETVLRRVPPGRR